MKLTRKKGIQLIVAILVLNALIGIITIVAPFSVIGAVVIGVGTAIFVVNRIKVLQKEEEDEEKEED